MNKGQSLLGVIMWATGISFALIGSAYGLISTKFTGVNDKITGHEGRISTTEQIVKEDIPQLKSDMRFVRDNLIRLMERQGIRPVEVATTTTKK